MQRSHPLRRKQTPHSNTGHLRGFNQQDLITLLGLAAEGERNIPCTGNEEIPVTCHIGLPARRKTWPLVERRSQLSCMYKSASRPQAHPPHIRFPTTPSTGWIQPGPRGHRIMWWHHTDHSPGTENCLERWKFKQLHDRALILAFNSPRKIPLPPNPNYLGFTVPTKHHCWCKWVSGQFGHDLELPGSPVVTVTDSERLGLPWERLRAAPLPRRPSSHVQEAAAAPVWRQGRADGVGRGVPWGGLLLPNAESPQLLLHII